MKKKLLIKDCFLHKIKPGCIDTSGSEEYEVVIKDVAIIPKDLPGLSEFLGMDINKEVEK